MQPALLMVLCVGIPACQPQREPPPVVPRSLPAGMRHQDPATVYRAQQVLADWSPAELTGERASLLEIYSGHVETGPTPWWVANATAMLAWLEAPAPILSALTHEDPNVRALTMLFAWRLPRPRLARSLVQAFPDQTAISLMYENPVGMASDQARSRSLGHPFPQGPIFVKNQTVGQIALISLLAMMGLNDERVHSDRAATARMATDLVERYGSRLESTRPLTRAMLVDADSEIRLWAATSLLAPRNKLVPMPRPGPGGPKAPDASAKACLAGMLTDPDSSVRLRAALTTGRLGDRSALAELHRQLPGQPELIAPVLGILRDRSSVPLLIAELKRPGSGRVIEARTQRLVQDGQVVERELQVTVADRLREALTRITGKDLGNDSEAWKVFFEKHQIERR